MMRRDLLLPASIVLGCALIGAGLYFGLRRDDAPAAPPATPSIATTASIASEDAAAPAVAPPSPPPPAADGATPPVASTAGEVDRTKATAEAQKAVAAWKKQLVPKCWAPMVAKAPEPATSKYSLQIAFDADGKEVGRGVSELRGTPSRADVADCLRSEKLGLSIPAPGAPITVEVELAFP